MYIYSDGLGKFIGFLRNHVFMIPLVLLCCVIILDRFIRSLDKKILRNTVYSLALVLMTLMTFNNLPSLHYALDGGRAKKKGGASMSGPVLRTLKAVDPHMTWNISFSKAMRYYYMGFLYYKQFDYKFNINPRGGNFNVLICRIQEMPPNSYCLDWDYFSKENCAVLLTSNFQNENITLQTRPVDD